VAMHCPNWLEWFLKANPNFHPDPGFGRRRLSTRGDHTGGGPANGCCKVEIGPHLCSGVVAAGHF
jgi:hypothetical protein